MKNSNNNTYGMMVEYNGKTVSINSLLNNGILKLTFKKRNGQIREAIATTMQKYIAGTLKGYGTSHQCVTPFFDLSLGEWRSFAWDTLISFEVLETEE